MDGLSLGTLRPIFNQLSYIDRLPLSRTNRYLHEVFLKLYPSAIQVLIEEYEHFGYDPSTLKLLFEQSPLPIKARGGVVTFISGHFLSKILHRDISPPRNIGDELYYTVQRLNFIRVVSDGETLYPCSKNRTIDGRILEENQHYQRINEGIFYHENTIAYPTSDVPRHFFNLDFEMDQVMMSRERFYIQDPESYRTRVRLPQKLVSPMLHSWLREQGLDGLSLILSSGVNVSPEFLPTQFNIHYQRMLTSYENVRKYIERSAFLPREPIKPFFWLWLDCIMRYDLPIFPAAMNVDLHNLYRQLESHRMSSYQLSKLGSLGSYRTCHKVTRIYPHVKEWQLRYYDITLPRDHNLTIGCYTGPFNIEMIRQHFPNETR